MKILLINKFLYPKGGDAKSTINTGKLLRSKGHDVFFWGMDSPDNPDYEFKEYFMPYVDLNNVKGWYSQLKAVVNILYSFEAKKRLEQLIKVKRPDIVHLNNFAHQISPSILHIFKKYNIPVVMTMRDYKIVCPVYTMMSKDKICEKCKNGNYYNCLINKCAKNSFIKSMINVMEMYLHHRVLKIYDIIDEYISPSMFLKYKTEEMGIGRDVNHLFNFVPLEDKRPTYTWKDKTIIYVGRLSAEKGLFTLIDAVKGLDVKLKIIGDGPIKAALGCRVRDEGLKNVDFLGYKKGVELEDEICESMFLVIPSEWYENNPRTVIEAFASGKPVIGARIGGIPELVKDGETGLLFESGNIDDLRDKIQCLLTNPDKIVEMGKKACRFVEEELNSERHYDSLIKIYGSIIK
ncbi:glycosyltransferase [Candidatus Pacearchaeota archaeon]|nr:glycosyltransferase [Candidatus Pacearchaeota archaeon]